MIPCPTCHLTRIAFFLVLAAGLFIPAPLVQAADGEKTKADLEAVLSDLEESRTRANALKAEAEALSRDRKALSEQLVSTVSRIRNSDTALEETEERLASLSERQQDAEAILIERRAELADLLAALQKLGRNPPPAVVVRPEDALTAVRSAMVFGSILPELRRRTDAVNAELTELARIRGEINEERSRIASQTEILALEKTRLEKLVSLRQESESEARGKLAEAVALTNQLAQRSESLRDLLVAIERAARGEASALPDDENLAALTDPGRLSARVPFARTLGRLPLPLNGAILTDYGDRDSFGSEAKGISIAANRNDAVTSPSDAWVVYSGPFRTYGQLLILNAGDGYHIVLAGLDRVSVSLGQFVLAGEPVGQMAPKANVANVKETPSNTRGSVLYVEFRKDGSAIDPSPWWADNRQRVQG